MPTCLDLHTHLNMLITKQFPKKCVSFFKCAYYSSHIKLTAPMMSVFQSCLPMAEKGVI